jgi:hypothetical protein
MLTYSIDLTSGITESLFSNIRQLTDNLVIRKRLTEITIELLQNISKHGVASVCKTLTIQKHASYFSVVSTNQILLKDVAALQNKIHFINSLGSAEVKKEHTRVLCETMLSEKSVAGLGLYRIAMRTKSALTASFQPISQSHHIFTLHVTLAA